MTGVVTAAVTTVTVHAEPADEASAATAALQAHPLHQLKRIQYLESADRQHPVKQHTLSAVLGDLNRKTRQPKTCAPGGGDEKSPYPDKGFCWNAGDTQTSQWMPQGLTNGSFDGHQGWAASWHNKGDTQSRVTFLDRAHQRYRHVVLADPGTSEGDDFKPVDAHAGGIAWIGHYLYVANSGKGIRVFDLNHVWKADGGKNDDRYTIKDGTVHAAGYGYVLPQVGSYDAEPAPKDPCQQDKNPFFSSISVDHASNRLVSGEYCGNSQHGRLVRWPLVADGKDRGLLESSDGTVRAEEWYTTSRSQMQGVATRGDEVRSTSSHGEKTNGQWHVTSLKGKKNGDTLHSSKHYETPAPGPEDVTFAGNRYWTLTEHPNKRYVFPSDAR